MYPICPILDVPEVYLWEVSFSNHWRVRFYTVPWKQFLTQGVSFYSVRLGNFYLQTLKRQYWLHSISLDSEESVFTRNLACEQFLSPDSKEWFLTQYLEDCLYLLTLKHQFQQTILLYSIPLTLKDTGQILTVRQHDLDL